RERADTTAEKAGELATVVEQAEQQEKDRARLDAPESNRAEARDRVATADAELGTLGERIADLREQHSAAATAAARVTDLRAREQELADLAGEPGALPQREQQLQREVDAGRTDTDGDDADQG